MTPVDEHVLALDAIRLGYKLKNEVMPEGKAGAPGISLVVLTRARNAAAEALMNLARVSPDDPKSIRALQNEVQRYFDLITWTQEAIDEGQHASEMFDRDDMEAVRADIEGWRTDEYEDADEPTA